MYLTAIQRYDTNLPGRFQKSVEGLCKYAGKYSRVLKFLIFLATELCDNFSILNCPNKKSRKWELGAGPGVSRPSTKCHGRKLYFNPGQTVSELSQSQCLRVESITRRNQLRIIIPKFSHIMDKLPPKQWRSSMLVQVFLFHQNEYT